MGFRFRKSVNMGPFRINFSKSGIGYSAGVKGFRVTKKATGGIRTTASIPGTGISYVQESGSSKKANTNRKEESDMSNDNSKEKKPFYKKWWFWLILGFIFIAGCFGGGDTTDNPSDTTVPATSYVEDTADHTTAPETTVPETTDTSTEAATTAATTVPNTEPEETEAAVFTYVLNTNTEKFHEENCKSVADIKDKNKAIFTGTREEVIANGYEPCGRCKP